MDGDTEDKRHVMLTQRKHMALSLLVEFAAFSITGYQIVDKPPFADNLFLMAAAIFGVQMAVFSIIKRIPARCQGVGCEGSAYVALKGHRWFMYTCGRCGNVEDSGVEMKPYKHPWTRD